VSGKLKVSPKTLRFGTVTVSDSVTKMVTIKNAGKTKKKDHPLPILIEMEAVNPAPSPFSVTMQCDGELMPGGKGVPKSETMCVAKVQFEPTQAVSYTGTLTIYDNLEPSEQTVQNDGQGQSTQVREFKDRQAARTSASKSQERCKKFCVIAQNFT